MPRGQNRAYIIVIKDLVNGWEFLEQDNLSRPLSPPRWSWFAENAQRFPRKQNAQYSLTQIKKRNRNCQMAVMCPVGETR